MTDKITSERARCPICRKLATPGSRPFCSPRCAQIDLGRWFREMYRVPAPTPGRDETDPPQSG